MTGFDRIERDLTVWFEDTAVPKVPDYVDEIVQEAVRGRQRPRWTFVGRWLPASVAGLGFPSSRVQWRPIVMLIVLALLLAAVVAFIGSRPRIPPPFGPAENGIVVFARDGDIMTFDPELREERLLLTGPEVDIDPMWSLDGMRFAFLRRSGSAEFVGFADRDGGRLVLSEPLAEVDPDSISWKPDGSGVVGLSVGTYWFIDAATGARSDLKLKFPELDLHWRPPNGSELMYRSVGPGRVALVLYSVDTGIEELVIPQRKEQVRPRGFSPDGKLFVYHTTDANDSGRQTFIYDLETRTTVQINAMAGRLSNDGTRIAAFRSDGRLERLCIAPAAVGDCTFVGDGTYAPEVTHSDGLNWSPDDDWLIVFPKDERGVVLVDPDGKDDDVVIPAQGPGSWQRKANLP